MATRRGFDACFGSLAPVATPLQKGILWTVLFTLTAMVWLKLSPQFLRLPLASLLTAVFSLMAVRPIRFSHMVDIVPHGLESVNSFLHTYITRFEGRQGSK